MKTRLVYLIIIISLGSATRVKSQWGMVYRTVKNATKGAEAIRVSENLRAWKLAEQAHPSIFVPLPKRSSSLNGSSHTSTTITSAENKPKSTAYSSEIPNLFHPELMEPLSLLEENTESKKIKINRRSWRWNYRISTAEMDNLEIYLSMPANAKEFKNIFGQINNAQLTEIQSIRSIIKDGQASKMNFASSAATLISGIDKSKSDRPIVVIGHNQQGNLYFPDGTFSSFAQMDSAAKVNKRVIVFLSCNAQDHTLSPAVKHYLSYVEALVLTKKLSNYQYEGKKQQTIKKELQDILNAHAKQAYLDLRLKVIVVGAALTTAGYGLYTLNKEELKPKPSAASKSKG